jgi:bla regulator protein blaR1
MMTELFLSLARSAVPAVANHLWQSTIFAGLVILTMLLLRNCKASVRYGLWLAASLKFFIPFSILIALGGLLPKPQRAAVVRQIAWSTAIDVAGQPFSDFQTPLDSRGTARLTSRIAAWTPAILAALWLMGTTAVLSLWYRKWRRVQAIRRRAVPVENGREVEVLRQLERRIGKRDRIMLLSTREMIEPGVVGISHPVLLWPHQLSDQLEKEHVEAILAHESMHVRRNDNLAAALHMFVEALFWFHPLVWWIERRLVEERERACDEAVVQLSGRPEAYAEGLLKVCRFCLESPLKCMSSMTGGDLRRRISSILNSRLETLSISRKLLLSCVGVTTFAVPVIMGALDAERVVAQAQGPSAGVTASLPAYAVSSVKSNKALDNSFRLRFAPDGVQAQNASLLMIMRGAWGLMNSLDDKFIGLPDWAKTEKFDIDAKVDSSDVEVYKTLSIAQKRLMLQAVLANRFDLKAHVETRNEPVLKLTVAKGGPKLKETNAGNDGSPDRPGIEFRKGQIVAKGIQMTQFASLLTQSADRTVLDRTGLSGRYDVTLDWAPDDEESSTRPPLFTALRDQLGLKLDAGEGPVEVLVIDHVERPSPN